MEEVAGRWVARTQALQFRVGPITLFSKRFKAMVLNVHFSRITTADLEPPFDQLRNDIEALLIHSQPTDEHLPRISANGKTDSICSRAI